MSRHRDFESLLNATYLGEDTTMPYDRGDAEQGDTELVNRCLKALRQAGIRIPPGVDPYNDLRLFLTTLTASAMNVAGADMDEPDDVNDEEGTEQEIPPVAMSLDRAQHDSRRQDAKRAFREARADRTVRLWDAALGRTPPGPNRGA